MNSEYFIITPEGDNVTLIFKPECSKIDAKNFSFIEEDALNVLKEHETQLLVFDLKNITYVSSAGLRMFSAINNAAQENGVDYKLINLTPDIKKMFQLTGYASIFTIE